MPLLAYGLSEIGCGITRMPPFLSVVVMGLAVDSLVGNGAARMQREWTMPKAVFACLSESDTSLPFPSLQFLEFLVCFEIRFLLQHRRSSPVVQRGQRFRSPRLVNLRAYGRRSPGNIHTRYTCGLPHRLSAAWSYPFCHHFFLPPLHIHMGNLWSSDRIEELEVENAVRRAVADLQNTVASLQNTVASLQAELGRARSARRELEHKVRELWPDHLARCVANAMAEAHAYHLSTLTRRCLL